MKNKITQYAAIVISFLIIFLGGCTNQSKNEKTISVNESHKIETKTAAEKLKTFGESYAAAWCSQQPQKVSAFFAPNGSLKVNNNPPAEGRKAIMRVARGFMTTFPDLIVQMDSLVSDSAGTAFYWTLIGTNAGKIGKGNKVRISGVEHWRFNQDELILESKGSFDAEEYKRQIKYGVKK